MWVGDVNVSVYVRACIGRLACISVCVCINYYDLVFYMH